jgi:hypothetical protein
VRVRVHVCVFIFTNFRVFWHKYTSLDDTPTPFFLTSYDQHQQDNGGVSLTGEYDTIQRTLGQKKKL